MVRIQEYIHELFGEVRVLWHEEPGFSGVVPFAFEADIFTPDGEVEDLTSWMRCVRLDRSISVSAFDSHCPELPF